MIRDGSPFCDRCSAQIEALSEEEAETDLVGHGWENYKTATAHWCTECVSKLYEDLLRSREPCAECRTQPCERGRECWYEPPTWLHMPYETYTADKCVPTTYRSQSAIESFSETTTGG